MTDRHTTGLLQEIVGHISPAADADEDEPIQRVVLQNHLLARRYWERF